ncbi:MAG: GNAT family N-acetyltransferase [Rhodoferax sp.]|uniref:GNAT family N-acetyltransferase n=1 Tax=Rhodoferax sp. TaxID=50421 RepID=UPI003017653A
MPKSLEWTWVCFADLSIADLYDLLQLRSEVFVVEQNCVFLDIDGVDSAAMHLLGHQSGQLVAYARCFPAGVKFSEASIGRVVTRRTARGAGVGHALVKNAIDSVCKQWGVQAIRIGAQAQLTRFYQALGFVGLGRAYIEDGIDHIEMLWTP